MVGIHNVASCSTQAATVADRRYNDPIWDKGTSAAEDGKSSLSLSNAASGLMTTDNSSAVSRCRSWASF